MRDIETLYSAKSESLWDTMNCRSAVAGFRIPEYQRPYSWGKENIKSLIENVANGLHYLTEEDESFTFLGTLILVSETQKEATFDGHSFAIVDGQQRLTTLVLTMCVVIESISRHHSALDQLSHPLKDWLGAEVAFQLDRMFHCAVGRLTGRTETYPFPRLVRSGDTRARKSLDYEYRSVVAKVLEEFIVYYREERQDKFEFPKFNDDLKVEAEQFQENFEIIRKQVDRIATSGWHDSESEIEIVEPADFKRKGIKQLFDKLDQLGNSSAKQNKELSLLANGTDADALVRLVLFAAYLTRCVVLTRVETDDENYAFDIFDALNTTGELLTAVETLKPRVVKFENSKNGFRGSDAEIAFDSLDRNLAEKFNNPQKRQSETKETIISFALYADGKKLTKTLSEQRKYLRSRYEKVAQSDVEHLARRFVSALAYMAEYRNRFWTDKDNIGQFSKLSLGTTRNDDVKLCLRLIRDMNTSMAIPLLCRYLEEAEQRNEFEEFLLVAKAITAFIVLRRAATGGTDNIDGEFRYLMGEKKFCAGIDSENELPNSKGLKSELRNLLARKFNVDNLSCDRWVGEVGDRPLFKSSQPLVRFLHFAAAHKAQPNENKAGLWSRRNVIATDERSYLTFANWIDQKYETIEHIAPYTKSGGWDESIYENSDTIHTLGNLTLLPLAENSSIGNAEWEKKRLLYQALTKRRQTERQTLINELKAEQYAITDRFEDLLKREVLHLLDPLTKVQSWNLEMIKSRTENTARLVWDQLWPWLSD